MDYTKIKLTIFGAGRWGMNHVKTAASLLPHENITVVDVNPSSGEKVKTVSEKINFTTDFDQSFTNQEPRTKNEEPKTKNEEPRTTNEEPRTTNEEPRTKNEELVIIATPAETHFEIAKKCLEAGKHVLVEKPITLIASEAEKLLNLSLNLNLRLMVGHVLLFHPAVTKMKEEIIDGKIGRLQYIYSNRLNLGAIRSEENSLWSFAPHDISIIQYLITSYMQSINHSSMQDDSVFPYSINAFGASHVQPGIEDSTLT
jgi:predicted dehydrogenase